MAKGKVADAESVQAVEFTKEQLLLAKVYENRRDLVNALLDDNKTYTKETVNSMIDGYMKGQVK